MGKRKKNEAEKLDQIVLDTINRYVKELKRTPTVREIKETMSFDSEYTIRTCLRHIEQKGIITLKISGRNLEIEMTDRIKEEKKRRHVEIRPQSVTVKKTQMHIKQTKKGDIIKDIDQEKDGWNYIEKINKYRVIQVYPNHVLCRDEKTGEKRCFCFGDLIMKGMEKQEDKLEAMRKA